MAITRSTANAPPPAVLHFAHENHVKQRHFPPRYRVSLPSTRPPRESSTKTPRQSTLTQLDFVSSSATSRGVDSDQDSDFDGVRKRKRRKMTVDAGTTPQQTTLTQIGWPFVPSSDDEEAETGEDDEPALEKAQESSQSTDSRAEKEVFVGIPNRHKDSARTTGQSMQKREPTIGGGSSVAAKRSTPQTDPQTAPISIDHARPLPGPSTPSNPIRREIPSSQSPYATPIATPCSAHEGRERTPLSEIHENIWKQRDATLAGLRTESETDKLELEVNELASDKENDELEMLRKTLQENVDHAQTTPAKTTSKARQGQNQEVPSSPCEFTPGSRMKCRWSTPRSISPSPAPRIFRKTEFLHPSVVGADARSITSNAGSPAGTVRSSQATTVDLTQPTPKRRANSPSAAKDAQRSASTVSASLAGPAKGDIDSQFPYSAFSVFTEEGDPDIPLGATLTSQFSALTDSSAA